MLIPLLFTVFLYLHKLNYDSNSIFYRIYFRLTQVIFVAVISTCFFVLKETMEVDIPFRYVKISVGIIALIGIFYAYSKYKPIRLISFVAALLVMRIIFNFFFIPERYQGDMGVQCKSQAIALGVSQKNKDLNIYKNSNIDLTSSVYISNQRQKITRRTEEILPAPGVTIFDTSRYELHEDIQIQGSICVREGQQTLLLVNR